MTQKKVGPDQNSSPLLKIFLDLIFIVVAIVTLVSAQTAFAEEAVVKDGSKSKSKKTITTTITTTENGEVSNDDDRVLTARFGATGGTGLAGCKTEELLKGLLKELKDDCSAWIKDRKADLKDKFLTGSCEEKCESCNRGLRRCHVEGLVHYKIN